MVLNEIFLFRCAAAADIEEDDDDDDDDDDDANLEDDDDDEDDEDDERYSLALLIFSQNFRWNNAPGGWSDCHHLHLHR